MALYQDLIEANIECSNWQSDLYFPVSEQSRNILAKYPVQKASATTFKSNIDGKLWYDVPFAFEPFWDILCSRLVMYQRMSQFM